MGGQSRLGRVGLHWPHVDQLSCPMVSAVGRHVALCCGSGTSHSVSQARPSPSNPLCKLGVGSESELGPGQWLPGAVGKPTMLTAPWLDIGTLSWRSCGQSWGAVGSPHLCPCLPGGVGKAWRPVSDAGTDAARPSSRGTDPPPGSPLPRLGASPGGLCLSTQGSSAQGPRGDGGVSPQRGGLFPKGWEGPVWTEP